MLPYTNLKITMVTALISHLVLSSNASPYPLLDRTKRQVSEAVDSQVPKHVYWPSEIVSVNQAQPNDAGSNEGTEDMAFIYSLPGTREDIAIEMTFAIPDDLNEGAFCDLGFFTLDLKFGHAEWLQNLDHEVRFSVYMYASTAVSASAEDTWDSRPEPDLVEGFIATGIANKSGVRIEGGAFECREMGPSAQFWVQCEEDQYCNIGWPETRSPLSGLVLRVYYDEES